MQSTKKFLNITIITAIALCVSIQISASVHFGSFQSQPQQPQTGRIKAFSVDAQPQTGFGSFTPQPQQPQTGRIKAFSVDAQPQTGFGSFTPQPQQPQKNLNWNSMEFKDYFQVIKESTETIKLLSDKVAVLEDTVKVMQAAMDTLKDTVSQNYSTSIKMLNEALKK